MATSTLTAAMPALELTEGESLVLEAIDATTGAAVTGVICKDFVIYATEVNPLTGEPLPQQTVFLNPTGGDMINPANYGGPAG